MQFVNGGPDVPAPLIEALEEGRVVFFSGAGVSYPAGLPDFRKLVADIYTDLSTARLPAEEEAFGKEQYDTTLELLERRHPGGRSAVRESLARVLIPNLRKKGASATHRALLQLAQDRAGRIRLVTTNFDRVFEVAKRRLRVRSASYCAPLLPVPKMSRWNGIVYLHGLIPQNNDVDGLNKLIISSGDFGTAYLTERWAARFVSELFRNFVVCFVGYSINDPVLRYMMDALAADKRMGEVTPDAYAFGSAGDDPVKAQSYWNARGVTPILYQPRATGDRHGALHQTLIKWADLYRDGALGKEGIVSQYAVNPPGQSSSTDDFVGRVLWAISDRSGLPAKRFAELEPLPPIDWLEAFTERRMHAPDLIRFGVKEKFDSKELAFSVLARPSTSVAAPWTALASRGPAESDLDEVQTQLAKWLIRHLADPKVILWVASSGGRIHRDFKFYVRRSLDGSPNSPASDSSDSFRKKPARVPPAMRKLWELVLADRIASPFDLGDVYGWNSRLRKDGLTLTSRSELREMLRPSLRITEHSEWFTTRKHRPPKSPKVSDLVQWEIVLPARSVHSAFSEKKDRSALRTAFPKLLDDFRSGLLEVMELRSYLGDATPKSDHSYTPQPSISNHAQNRRFHDWTVLIELCRDAWLAVKVRDVKRARQEAIGWWTTPFPVFKRMALFAATYDDVGIKGLAVDWLLEADRWWLWTDEVRREVMRFLVKGPRGVSPDQQSRLVAAVLKGPPRAMFSNEMPESRWLRIREHLIWLRLAKLRQGGYVLSRSAQTRLKAIQLHQPFLKLNSDAREEFPFWMDSGDVSSMAGGEKKPTTPKRRRELVKYIRSNPTSEYWTRDDWRVRCSKDFKTTATTLFALAKQGVWPTDRWRDALQAWAEPALLLRSWRYMAPLVADAPDDFVAESAHGIGWWLQAVGKNVVTHEPSFFQLSRRVISLSDDVEESKTDPVGQAINHPVGHVAEAVIRFWFSRGPKDGDGLPEGVEGIFTSLCDVGQHRLRHGRVILGANLIALFRVDPAWTEFNLLPLFDWSIDQREARRTWEGFLWTPRIYPPLLKSMRQSVLDAALHYSDLGEHSGQFADFLTFVALEPDSEFTQDELSLAFANFPEDGLQHVASALSRALGVAAEQRDESWRNRVKPFVRMFWPKLKDAVSPRLSESIARLCLAADENFPESYALLKDWIVSSDHSDYVIHLAVEGKFGARFPEQTLNLVHHIVPVTPSWISTELDDLLDAVAASKPKLKQSVAFQRLLQLARIRS